MSWLRRRQGCCAGRARKKTNFRRRPGLQRRFLSCPIAASFEVIAYPYLSLMIAIDLPALIPFIKKILVTTFQMDQGSCGLGKTPRYRNNSWLCRSGLPQNSRRFVGGQRRLPKRVCLEAGQGMVFHQRHSLHRESLAKVSRERRFVRGLSERHQTRFHAVRARFSRRPLAGDHRVRTSWPRCG